MMNRGSNDLTRDVIGAETGFTLVELLVAMTVSIIVLAAIIGMFSNLSKSYTTETARASAQQDVRSALALMCEDIIHAGLDPAGTADSSITTLGAADIAFTADMDYDGAITAGNNEQIRYFLNGNQLVQQLDGSSDAVLLDNVTDLSFVYLDENDTDVTGATGPRDDVHIIQITMTIQPPAGRAGSVTRTLSQQVRLRNSLS